MVTSNITEDTPPTASSTKFGHSSHYGHAECPVRSVAAGEVEAAVLAEIRALLRRPEIVARTLKAVADEDETIDDAEVVEALQALDPLWDELFPAEQGLWSMLVYGLRQRLAPRCLERPLHRGT
jgi:hypothetical protein